MFKRVVLALFAASAVAVAAAYSVGERPFSSEFEVEKEERNPWTHLRLNNDREEFQFVVVSDRTGGHRARVFSQAVEQLNLLQPEFVISVGDLIEGYTEDRARMGAEWREFQGFVSKLQMPFFYVPGNHDLSNAVMEKEWRERFGRRWYHFVYRDVLFLMLNSDDPAKGGGTIGKEQLAYVARALAENPNPRWTIVAMHKPLWDQKNLPTNGWLEVERLLSGRPYTVFVGHEHEYRKFVRHGQNYYQLATTGGISRMRGIRYGEFDHVVWVTMKRSGPVLANLMLDGIFPEDMRRLAGSEEPEHVYFDRKRPHPARGKVYLDGAPVADAEVAFHLLVTDAKTKKTTPRRTADALTDADGSFVLSTYSAFDGAPPGPYQITVVQRQPRFDASGRPGPNLLPARYAAPDTSGLKGEVRTGQNEFIFNLTR